MTTRDVLSRRTIDHAVGVLIGLRGCTQEAAFDELVAAVRRSNRSLSEVASALVTAAGGRGDGVGPSHIWADLFADPRTGAPGAGVWP